MAKIIKVTEENGKLALKYFKNPDLWSLFWILFSVSFPFLGTDIDLGIVCLLVVTVAMIAVPLFLQQEKKEKT